MIEHNLLQMEQVRVIPDAFWKGDFAEIILDSTALSSSHRSQIEEYSS